MNRLFLARSSFSSVATSVGAGLASRAEVRTQNILGGVLSTLLSDAETPSATLSKLLGSGTDVWRPTWFDDRPEIIVPLRVPLDEAVHSHPSLQKLYNEILQVDDAYSGWTEHGFTVELLRTLIERSGGDASHADVIMAIMDTNGDGVISWQEFWAYHVVMEDGYPDEQVQMLLRGGDVDGSNTLSRGEFAELTSSLYLGALAMRGKAHDMKLLDAARVVIPGRPTPVLPGGIQRTLRLLTQPEEDWVDGYPVAVLRTPDDGVFDDVTLREFAEVVGRVTANYTFAAANETGDTLDPGELGRWVAADHPSFRFVKHLFVAMQPAGRRERRRLIKYLEENHKVIQAPDEIAGDDSLLGLLKQEVRRALR